MNLPPFPALDDAALAVIAQSVGAATWRRLPDVGIFNRLYSLDDAYLLRVPRNAPDFLEALAKEAVVIPQARSAGVVTPKVIAFDDSRQLLETPYLLLEYVGGTNLAALGLEPEQVSETWRRLGEQLALLHRGVKANPQNQHLRSFSLPSAAELSQRLAAGGFYTESEHRWLAGWLTRLATRATPAEAKFCHGDIQSTNLMVDGTGRFLALIDWGAAGWSDPAHDFAGVPLRAVPFMLEGYEAALGEQGLGFRARILQRHLQLALFLASRPPTPEHSWAERPLGMLVEILRFASRRSEGWGELFA